MRQKPNLKKVTSKGTFQMSIVQELLSGLGNLLKQQLITKEEYEASMINVKPITSITLQDDSFEIIDCSTGACPIK
jgi:hypothetical protein